MKSTLRDKEIKEIDTRIDGWMDQSMDGWMNRWINSMMHRNRFCESY